MHMYSPTCFISGNYVHDATMMWSMFGPQGCGLTRAINVKYGIVFICPWFCSFYWYVLYLICFIVTLFTYTIQLILSYLSCFFWLFSSFQFFWFCSPTRLSSLFMLLYHFFLFYIPVSFLRVAYRKICLACDLSAPVMKGYWSSWVPSHLTMYMKLIVVEKKFIFFGGVLTNKILLLL